MNHAEVARPSWDSVRDTGQILELIEEDTNPDKMDDTNTLEGQARS